MKEYRIHKVFIFYLSVLLTGTNATFLYWKQLLAVSLYYGFVKMYCNSCYQMDIFHFTSLV